MESAKFLLWGNKFINGCKELGNKIADGAVFAAKKTKEGAIYAAQKTKEGAIFVGNKTKEGALMVGEKTKTAFNNVKTKVTGEQPQDQELKDQQPTGEVVNNVQQRKVNYKDIDEKILYFSKILIIKKYLYDY